METPGAAPGGVPLDAARDPVQVMAVISGRRVAAWSVLDELTAVPDGEAWVERLGPALAGLKESTAWLDEEWRPHGLLLLEGLVRRAARRGGEDVAALAQDSAVAAQPGLGRLHRAVAQVHELAVAEHARWRAGDADGAKELRVEQMALLDLGSPVRQEAAALAAARLPVWSPAASLVADYLLLETGR